MSELGDPPRLHKAPLRIEARSGLLLDDSPAAYLEIGSEGGIRGVNRAACALLGYGAEELLGKPLWDLAPPEDRGCLHDLLKRQLSGAEQIEAFKGSFLRKDGSAATIDFYAGPIEDEGGLIEGMRGLLVDAGIQDGLAKERDLTSAVIDTAGSLIVVLDPDGRILRFNRACEQVSGYSFEEVKGRAFWDVLIIPKEVEPLRSEVFSKIREGMAPILHENHWRTRSGELRLIAWSNVALRDGSEGTTYVASTGIDITERRRAELAVRVSEQRYRDLFENANDLVYTHDLRGQFTSVNAAAEKITGYTRAEALEMNMAQVAAPEELAGVLRQIDSKLGGEGPTTYEFDILAKDGRRVSLEASTRLQIENGKPIGIHGVARDITGRKLAEAELARKNKELAVALEAAKEATELKSRFLATMSHEIRTPMNGILGMIELLTSTPLDAEQLDYAEAVRHSAEALLTVINDILDISKIEAGKLMLERLPFDPRAVAEEVTGLLAPRAVTKGLRLRYDAKSPLPRVVRGDPGRLRQVLLNLIGNAVKFTEVGEVTVSAEFTAASAETVTLRFSVRDTGIGISPANRGRLFESFVQGDSSTTRKYGGTGLGLAISKQLVEMMGGVIEVESELGHGSAFSFQVAFEKCTPEAAARPVEAEGGGASLAGTRTLVVGGQADEGAITGEYLEILGCRNAVAGRDGLLDLLRQAAADGDPYRVVLLDLSPPEPEVFSLARAIANDPVISSSLCICCAPLPVRGQSRWKEFGFAGALQKPVTPSQLQETLAAALGLIG
jgi:PAS domain S-box-containing protein